MLTTQLERRIMMTSRNWIASLAMATFTLAPALARAAEAKGDTSKVQTIALTVTNEGFVLAKPNATVKVGQPVKLVVTRKTDQTCVKEIVIQAYGINQPLPLDKTVEVSFTPKKAGPIEYTCGMGMAGPPIVAK
jgi:plastocyanin domain-containing protein